MRTMLGRVTVAALACLAAACGSGPESPRSKQIYSVLQSVEYDLRQQKIDRAYVYSRNVLGSNYDTIAFPLKGHRQRYVVFLANPENGEDPYSVPSADDHPFTLDEATFHEIAAKKYIADSLQDYLGRYVERQTH